MRRETNVILKLSRRYHVGVEEVVPRHVLKERLLRSQNAQCPLCLRRIDQQSGRVDHDHRTRRVRGLLCVSCNVRVGQLEAAYPDGWLERARRYLEAPQLPYVVGHDTSSIRRLPNQ